MRAISSVVILSRREEYNETGQVFEGVAHYQAANEACDAGRVLINDKPAKASTNVRVGDILTIQFGNKETKVEILDVQETVKKDDAKELFRYI